MSNQVSLSHTDLSKLIADGHFFDFCVGYACTLGHQEALKQRQPIKIPIGDYDAEFVPDGVYFKIAHKVYIARIILAYPQEVHFVGTDENEIIHELLDEFKKEIV